MKGDNLMRHLTEPRVRKISPLTARSAWHNLVYDISILNGDVASDAAWRDVAGTAAVNAGVLSRFFEQLRQDGESCTRGGFWQVEDDD